MITSRLENINSTIYVDGDKSISHRAIFFGAISNGTTTIEGFLLGEDCLSTIECFKNLGVNIEILDKKIIINGVGLHGLTKPKDTLYVGNSGTTIRLISGLLAGQKFSTSITGDLSIQKRPMMRIIEPLSKMNANIKSNNGLAPLYIEESELLGMEYTLPIASAQVKSSIIFASLYAKSPTIINEPIKCRDHTEIMLKNFGGNIKLYEDKIYIEPNPSLKGQDVFIPKDISSASFFIVLALITKGSCITVKDVGLNETRTGIIDALLKMNANIEIKNERFVNGERIGDICAKSSTLIGTTLEGDIIPRMIDEIPIFVIATLFAKGKSVVKDAKELKVKETNRIKAIVTECNKVGANLLETSDGIIINETNIDRLKGTNVESYFDHRIAMSLAILGCAINGKMHINNSDCINISFPSFTNILNDIKKRV